jgi:bla regulator protein BlaR1
VIDKTGLKAEFDITLQWTPDAVHGMQPSPDVPRSVPADTDAPPIFTALQEQLGLKLKSQKGPVQTPMIDRAEEPSEN